MIKHAAAPALLALLLAAPLAAQEAPPPAQPTPYASADPMIGTGGEGHTFPGATAPFGMIQLSPDTDTSCEIRKCYSHAAGYRYDDPTIQGFSMTHFSGAGHSDLGDFLVMPLAGDTVPLDPGDPERPGSGYRSRFGHAGEVAAPGYYAVTLDDAGVRAEMTAGTRVGVERYSFRGGEAAHLVLDLRSSLYNYPGKVLWSSIRIRPDGTITGARETRGWAPARKLYFAMRANAPLAGHAFVNRETDVAYKGFQGPSRGQDDAAQLQGRALVARLDFGTLTAPLEVKVAISSVDEDAAIANLDSEPGGFDAIRATSRAAWEQALSAVRIDAPAPMRKTLYTALYHALLAPSVFSDADGRYRGPDDQVHKAGGFTFHSTFSLWDTFRAEHPLLTADPARGDQRRFHQLADRQPRTEPVRHPARLAISGARDLDDDRLSRRADHRRRLSERHQAALIPTRALDAMVASATYAPYGGLGDYMKLGYVPIDREPEAASKTVEYAYDDWTIARMARAMGKTGLAAQFETARGQLAQQLRREDRVPPRPQGRRQLPRALRSHRDQLRLGLYRGQCLAIFVVRAAGPGGHVPHRSAATRPRWRSSTRCSISTIRSSTTATPRTSPG